MLLKALFEISYFAVPYNLHEKDTSPTFRELAEERQALKEKEQKDKERMKEITNTMWQKAT